LFEKQDGFQEFASLIEFERLFMFLETFLQQGSSHMFQTILFHLFSFIWVLSISLFSYDFVLFWIIWMI